MAKRSAKRKRDEEARESTQLATVAVSSSDIPSEHTPASRQSPAELVSI